MLTIGVMAGPLGAAFFPGRADAANSFGQDPWNDMLQAANNATKCAGLTTNELTAMMGAASWRETVGGGAPGNLPSPSPMTMGRADTAINLYSFAEAPTERRAFWHAGVGLFQLDTLATAVDLAAWERVYVPTAAPVAAKVMADRWCSASGSEANRRVAAWSNWVACNGGGCETLFNNVYDSAVDNWKNLTKDSTVTRYGGMIQKNCKSTSASTTTFVCFNINPGNAQGTTSSWTGNPQGAAGTASPSPLTGQMINYRTATSSKREFWFASDNGFTRNIAKVVNAGVAARNVNGWQSPFSTCVNYTGPWVCGA